MHKTALFSLNTPVIKNVRSFLLAKNDKNYVEYMAMCGIFSKVRDNSPTLCYNVLKDFFHENYQEDENFRQLSYSAEVIACSVTIGMDKYRVRKNAGFKYFNYSFRAKKKLVIS